MTLNTRWHSLQGTKSLLKVSPWRILHCERRMSKWSAIALGKETTAMACQLKAKRWAYLRTRRISTLCFHGLWWQKTQDLKWCYSAISQGRAPMSKGMAVQCLPFPLSSHPRCSPSPGKCEHTPLRWAVESFRICYFFGQYTQAGILTSYDFLVSICITLQNSKSFHNDLIFETVRFIYCLVIVSWLLLKTANFLQ